MKQRQKICRTKDCHCMDDESIILDKGIEMLRRVVQNSVDEVGMGYADEIRVEVDSKKNCISIADNGCGIPKGKVPLAFGLVNNAGGMYDDSWMSSFDPFGGVRLVVANSICVEIVSRREGFVERVVCRESSIVDNCVEVNAEYHEHGLMVRFNPRNEVWKIKQSDRKRVEELVNDMTKAFKGLNVVLKWI